VIGSASALVRSTGASAAGWKLLQRWQCLGRERSRSGSPAGQDDASETPADVGEESSVGTRAAAADGSDLVWAQRHSSVTRQPVAFCAEREGAGGRCVRQDSREARSECGVLRSASNEDKGGAERRTGEPALRR